MWDPLAPHEARYPSMMTQVMISLKLTGMIMACAAYNQPGKKLPYSSSDCTVDDILIVAKNSNKCGSRSVHLSLLEASCSF